MIFSTLTNIATKFKITTYNVVFFNYLLLFEFFRGCLTQFIYIPMCSIYYIYKDRWKYLSRQRFSSSSVECLALVREGRVRISQMPLPWRYAYKCKNFFNNWGLLRLSPACSLWIIRTTENWPTETPEMEIFQLLK